MIAGKHFPKEENLEKMVQVLNVQPQTLFKFSSQFSDKELINDINRLINNAPSAKIRLAHRLITAIFDEN